MRLYGPGFAEGWPVLVITLLGGLVLMIQAPITDRLVATSRMWSYLFVHVVWAAVFVAGTFLVVPSHAGSAGLALARLLSLYRKRTVSAGAGLLAFTGTSESSPNKNKDMTPSAQEERTSITEMVMKEGTIPNSNSNTGLLSEMPPEIDAFIDRLYAAEPRPATYLSGAIRKHEIKLLVQLYLSSKPASSVEWGLGSGISASAFSYARRYLGLSKQHVALDPFQEKFSGGWGFKCLDEFQTRELIEFHPITSEEYLVRCRGEGLKFDFAFIDGAHDIGHKLADATLIADVMTEGGIVSFHDSMFRSTSLAISYLVEDRGFER